MNGFPWSFILGTFIKICRENPNLAKLGQFRWRSKYVLLLPATLNRHESALFQWNGIRLLGQPMRYKYYANAAQRYVVRTLLITHFLFRFRFISQYPWAGRARSNSHRIFFDNRQHIHDSTNIQHFLTPPSFPKSTELHGCCHPASCCVVLFSKLGNYFDSFRDYSQYF